jgi:hypothetical protein
MSWTAMANCTSPSASLRAFCGSVSVLDASRASTIRGKSAAASVCRLKRLLPALTVMRFSLASSETSASSGSERRMS